MNHPAFNLTARVSVLSALLLMQPIQSFSQALPPRLGSWGQTIKKSGTATGYIWDQNDLSSHTEALKETYQNFIIFDINSGKDWGELTERLLPELVGTDIQVVAAMASPHLSAGVNRWFRAVPPTLSGGTDVGVGPERWTFDHDVIAQWHKAWVEAATACSEVSRTYPNLIGFTINDFDLYVETPEFPAALVGSRLALNAVQRIADAAHSRNLGFKFFPVLYYGDPTVGDGYILGSNYGVALFPDDEMYVALSFYITGTPASGTLEFFHTAAIGELTTADVFKQVFVNGLDAAHLVHEAGFADDQSIQRFSFSISGLLRAGSNTIYLRLKPGLTSPAHDGGSHLIWQIWDVTVGGMTLIDLPFVKIPWPYSATTFSESFYVNPHMGQYVPAARDSMGFPAAGMIANTDPRIPPGFPANALPDDPLNGFLKRRLLAGRNADYLIRNAVDGVIMTSTQADPSSYDSSEFAALLDSVRNDLSGGTFISLHWAMLPGANIDLSVLADQLTLASQVADVTAVWNLPLGVHFLDDERGIFAQNATSDSSYSVMALWPGRQMTVPGWYQEFSYRATATAKLTLTVKDIQNVSGATNILYKSAWALRKSAGLPGLPGFPGAGLPGLPPFYLPEPVYARTDISLDDTSASAPISVTLDSGDMLVCLVEMENVDVSNWPQKVFFKLQDSTGALLDASHFAFDSGLSDSTAIDVYEAVTGTFAAIRASFP